MIDPQRDLFVSLDEVARTLLVHPRTVWNWTRRSSNALEVAKAGGVLRTTWPAVQAFLRTNQEPRQRTNPKRTAAAKKLLKERHGL